MATAERTQAHLEGERLAQAKLKAVAERRAGWAAQHCADLVGVSRRTLYEWTQSDPEFGESWADAYEGGSDWAEDKLRDRVEGGNVDATLAMLRIRRRLVPDAPPPAIQIQVLWQGAEPSGARVIEGEAVPILADRAQIGEGSAAVEIGAVPNPTADPPQSTTPAR